MLQRVHVLALLLAACGNEEIVKEPPVSKERVITPSGTLRFTADGPSLRELVVRVPFDLLIVAPDRTISFTIPELNLRGVAMVQIVGEGAKR